MIVRVCKGDTLSSIASAYHTTAQEIQRSNQLKGEIYLGMRLLVKGYVYRFLSKGQTIASLCAELCVDPSRAHILNDGVTVRIDV